MSGHLRLYIVRHGVTEWNVENRWQGQTDIQLSADGREQAKRIADRLSNYPLTEVWSSDLSRAVETAKAIANPHKLPVNTTPRLRETGLGEWEGLTPKEIVGRGDGKLWEGMKSGDLNSNPPASEPLPHVWERLNGWCSELRDRLNEGHVVVVGHGGSLKHIICNALGADLPCVKCMSLDNASLTIIDYHPPRVTVRLVNDTRHLG